MKTFAFIMFNPPRKNVWNSSVFALLAITWYQLPWILCWHRDNSCEVTTPIRPAQILMFFLHLSSNQGTSRLEIRRTFIFYFMTHTLIIWWERGPFLSAFITLFMRVFMAEGGLFGQISREGVVGGNWSVPYNIDIKLS